MTEEKKALKQLAKSTPAQLPKLIEINGTTYRLTPKFNRWVKAYNDPESDTYGNATQSIIKAYGLDKDKQYEVATVMGTENLGKLSDIVRDLAQRNGVSLQQFWKVAFKNAFDFDRSDQHLWWKTVGKTTGYHQEGPDTQINIQNNVQNNTQINVSKQEQTDWNKEFQDFLEKR